MSGCLKLAKCESGTRFGAVTGYIWGELQASGQILWLTSEREALARVPVFQLTPVQVEFNVAGERRVRNLTTRKLMNVEARFVERSGERLGVNCKHCGKYRCMPEMRCDCRMGRKS